MTYTDDLNKVHRIDMYDRAQMRKELNGMLYLADYADFQAAMCLFVQQWRATYPVQMGTFFASEYHKGCWAYSFTGMYNEHNTTEGRNHVHKLQLRHSLLAMFPREMAAGGGVTVAQDLLATADTIRRHATRQDYSHIPTCDSTIHCTHRAFWC
jgi:hypothetical protein